MNGTRISSTFDGRWVNTIVRISPNRAASGPAASAENAARMLAANRMPPTIAGSASNWLVSQKAMNPEHDEAAAEGIEREQGRQAGDDRRATCGGPASSRPVRRDAGRRDGRSLDLDRPRQQREDERHRERRSRRSAPITTR